MLGVGRSYTSRVMQIFKTEKIVEIRRAALLVRDFEALNARSCLYNENVKRHFEDVLRGVYPGEGALEPDSKDNSRARRLIAIWIEARATKA